MNRNSVVGTDDKLNLLFPIETFSRELDFRLFLAKAMLREGTRIFIGHHSAFARLIRLGVMRGGVYVGKQLIVPRFTDQVAAYEKFRRAGFKTVYLDEEGAIYHGGEREWREALATRVDPRRFAEDDYVCAWGSFQAEVYRRMAGKDGASVVVTGHPRFDLYKHPYSQLFRQEAERIRARLGRFVLFNTNFTLANNASGMATAFSPIRGYRAEDPESRERGSRLWAHTSRLLTHFIELLHVLANSRPELVFVVRPHPSEEPEFYRTALSGIPNVRVERTGSVGPWLLAAEALLHNGCTTAVEATLLGKRVLTYVPIEDPIADKSFPNLFGHKCQSAEQVLSALDGGPAQPDAIMGEMAKSLLFNLTGDSFGAVVDVARRAASTVKPGVSPGKDWLRAVELMRAPRALWNRVGETVSMAHRRRASYFKGKFPGFKPAEVIDKLNNVQQIVGTGARITFQSEALLVLEM
jgi:surface carbohydrate biosynthesis protein